MADCVGVFEKEEALKVVERLRVTNPEQAYVLRGRHSDRKGLFAMLGKRYSPGGENNVPVKYAETVAIYMGKELKRPRKVRNWRARVTPLDEM